MEENAVEPKLISIICMCGETQAMHGDLPGKTGCLRPGCSCSKFRLAPPIPVEKETDGMEFTKGDPRG